MKNIIYSDEWKSSYRAGNFKYLDQLAGSRLTDFVDSDRFSSYDEVKKLEPWVAYPLHVACNPARFPRLFGLEDPRTPYT